MLCLLSCASQSSFDAPLFSDNRKVGVLYSEIAAFIKGEKKYQELSPEAQKLYIKSKKDIQIVKELLKSKKITGDHVMDYLLREEKIEEKYSFNDWYSKGVGEFFEIKYKKAIDSFKKALETRPNTEPEAYTHNYIGLANYRLGNYPDAIEYHSEAIKLLPKYDDAHTNRGVVYAALGNYKEAFADLNKACELYIIRGKYKKASINLKVMLTLLEKADIDEGMRKSVESDIEQFRKQMGEVIVEERIMKFSFTDWYYKGVGEHINGKYDEAIISFKRALDKTPDDTFASYTYNYIGASYGKAGNDTEALKNYTESIRLKPNKPLPFLNRGDVYRRSGQKDKAYEDLNTASGLIEREKINPKTKVFYNELLKMLENNLKIN